MNKEQAVAEDTKETPQGTSTEAGAQADEDLDSLLADFKQPDKEPSSGASSDKDDLRAELQKLKSEREKDRQEINSLARDKAEAAVNETVEQIATELPQGTVIPSKALRGWLELEAVNRPELTRAFVDRHRDPAKWGKIVKGLAKELASELPDQAATEDRNAVVSAMHSASTKQAPVESGGFDEAAVRSMSQGDLYKNFPDLGKR